MKKGLTLTILIFTLLGCTREQEEQSKIVINTPASLGVGSHAALPTDRKPCYAVNVTSPQITANSLQCGIQRGMMSAFVEAGQSIVMEAVPHGGGNVVELFLYLLPTSTGSCPTSIHNNLNFLNLYSVDKLANLTFDQPETVLNMAVNFPGEANHYALGNNACSFAKTQDTLQITMGGGSLSTANNKIQFRIKSLQSNNRETISGGSHKIKLGRE